MQITLFSLSFSPFFFLHRYLVFFCPLDLFTKIFVLKPFWVCDNDDIDVDDNDDINGDCGNGDDNHNSPELSFAIYRYWIVLFKTHSLPEIKPTRSMESTECKISSANENRVSVYLFFNILACTPCIERSLQSQEHPQRSRNGFTKLLWCLACYDCHWNCQRWKYFKL